LGFQYTQRRERKASLECHPSHIPWLPPVQGAPVSASLQVPVAGWSQASLSKCSGCSEDAALPSSQSAKWFLLTHLPVFSSRFLTVKTSLAPLLVSVRIRRISLVFLAAAVLHAVPKTPAEKVLFHGYLSLSSSSVRRQQDRPTSKITVMLLVLLV